MRNLYLAALFLAIIFVWTRFYQIETSLNFINDMGRDFLVLWKWQDSGKPPLLGPQTSALPFNQSAIYFYLLYPFYLISGQSPYSTLIAYSSFYLATFAFGLYSLRKYPRLEKSLLLVFLMVIVHPEFIRQGRFVWNPSFVAPCIIFAFYSLVIYLEQKKASLKLLFANAFSLALATAFSYSALPALLAFTIFFAFRRSRESVKYLFFIAASLFTVNLPTIIFELRHGFLLSKMLVFGDRLAQSENYFIARLLNLSEFSFASNWQWALVYLLFFVLAFNLSYREQASRFLKASSILFASTLLLTLLSPSTIHAHYIFAILPLFFIAISLLEKKFITLSAIFFYIIWLSAGMRYDYFKPARNSYSSLESCAKNFCQNNQEPVFVTNQSKHHPYHNAMEWQYLLSQAGCQVKEINLEQNLANQLVVALDDSEYEHGKTAFYELTLFGESKEIERQSCSNTIEMVLLQKSI